MRNDSDRVVLVPEEARGTARPVYEGRLPAGATDFRPSTGGFDDAIEEREGRILYWGPVYPDGQDLRFHWGPVYTLFNRLCI